jgi:hypothetical protein
MKKKLIKIPLQFFGEEPEDDFEDNYEDDFEDDIEDSEDGEEELGGGEDAEAGGDGAADPEGDKSEDGDGEKGTAPESDGNGETQLIAELKALGYVGDDLASLASDMKTKREAKDATAKSKQRQADLKASQAHIKGSKPGQGATAGAGSGFTERQVSDISTRTGCSKDRARALLAKHHRLMNGG